MRRYTKYMNGEKYLGNTALKIVHDLMKEKQRCSIDNIVFNEYEKPFSTLDKAHMSGYTDCQYCIDHSEKLADDVKENNRFVYL